MCRTQCLGGRICHCSAVAWCLREIFRNLELVERQSVGFYVGSARCNRTRQHSDLPAARSGESVCGAVLVSRDRNGPCMLEQRPGSRANLCPVELTPWMLQCHLGNDVLFLLSLVRLVSSHGTRVVTEWLELPQV